MSHDHSPEDDIPCTACEVEGSRSRLDEDGLCPDCRTPAGRLVTALGLLGIKATANKRGIVRVEGHTFVCEPGDASVPWVISDAAETLDDATEAAANAIAAIVQAPGLRAEREALLTDERARLIALVREGEWGPQRNGPVTREQYDAVRNSAHQHILIAQSAMNHVEMRDAVSRAITDGLRSKNDALAAERDTLAAEVKRLREELEKPVVDAWAGSVRLLDVCTVAWSTPAHFIPGKDEVGWWAQHPDGDLIASGPETGDAGRHAADLALLAAGYRLVGGVHPLPDEVPHG